MIYLLLFIIGMFSFLCFKCQIEAMIIFILIINIFIAALSYCLFKISILTIIFFIIVAILINAILFITRGILWLQLK